jgi:CBS-domain-containing membrane protein
MVVNRLHRVPVLEGDGRLANYISQSEIVHFLHHHVDKFGKVAQLTSKELSLHNVRQPVITCPSNKRAIDAFRMLKEHRISGMPVVDSDQKLCGNFSLHDITVRLRDANREEETESDRRGSGTEWCS